ncbi:phage tail tape measure protein [Pseudomonas fulva]|uniref:phage tail tape measure protein n=1 Tax=Pseudomonas fulva TaxID=47880 RepID=UPI003F8F21B9
MALKSRLELEVDGRSAEQQVNDIRAALEALEQAGVRASSTLRKSGGEFTNLAMSLAKVQAANDKTATSTDTATKSAEAAAKAAANQRKELDALLGKIDPLTKKLNELAEQEAALAQARSSGQINTATFDAYSLKLQDSLNALAGVSRAQKAVGETADQARQRILGVAEAAVKAAQEQRNLANAATGLSEAEQGLLSGNMVLAANQGKLAQSSQKVAEANRQAQAAIGGQTESLQDLLASIDPTTRALNRLDEQERKLAQQKRIGAIDAETFSQYQGKIDQARAALSSFDDGLTRTGNTAKQNAAALRMLPAQFSDIFISLQGGQAPLTVFLQQGSQIKDSFGGIGAAAKAMGSYIYGLINPLTVAAASGVALAAVFVNAEREASALNKALFSGSASSGQTAEGLSRVAKEVASITGRLSAARDVVIALAASTGLSESQFRNLAGAAGSISEFTGKGASEVASSLGDVGDSATKAAQKISAQYGLLTSAQYDVIKGLEDQGRKQEALDLLSETLNKNAQERLKRYRASLSDIERDWNNIGTAISNAYSKVRGELFPDTAKEIEIIERILKTRKEGGVAGAISNGLSSLHGALGLRSEGNDDSTPALEKRLAALRSTVALNQQNAAAEGKSTRENQSRIKAETEWAALVKSNYSAEKKLAEDIAHAKRLGIEAGRSQLEIDKEVADIQAKYDKSKAKPKAVREDAGQKMLDDARQRYAVLQQQTLAISGELGQTQKLGAEARKLVELETEIANLKEKKTLTTSQKQVLAMAEMNLAQQKQNAELERANELTKERYETEAKLKAFRENLQSQLSTAREGQAVELEGYGQGDKLRQRLQEDLKIRQEYQRELDKVTRDYNRISNPTASDTALYQGQTEAMRSALSTRLSDQQAYYAQVDKLQSDWTVGATQAMNTYAEQAADVASQTRNLFSSAFGNMEDAVVNFVKTGKLSFKDFADQVVADLIRIQVRQAAAGFLNMAISTGMQLYGGGANGFAAGSAAATSSRLGASAAGYSSAYGFSSGGYTGPGGVNEPAGIVHKGEVVWSQDDIKRAGGVQAVEGLRNGNVSPTSRDSNSAGSSTRSGAAGASGAPVINQVFNVNGDVSQETIAMMQQMVKQGTKQALELVVKDARANGPITQTMRRSIR